MWKQFRDTNYEVSDKGEVRNRTTHKIIAQSNKDNKPNTYKKVAISIKGKDSVYSVHRMVLEAFTYRADDKEVNHINLKKDDNRLCNLEYCTREENREHAFKNNKNIVQRKPVVGINLETKEIIEFRSLYMAGKYIAEKKCKKGEKVISHYATTISQAIKGEINSTNGCYWWFKEEFDFNDIEKMIESKKKPDKYTKEQQDMMKENNLNVSIVNRRMKKYGLTLDEALMYKKNHIFVEPKEIEPKANSKYMQGLGKRFGNLEVLDVIRIKGKKPLYKCKGDCGELFTTQATNVLIGKTKGCGRNCKLKQKPIDIHQKKW